ncbi:ATP-binding protein [Gemmata sp.]|uniref:sensor histidine kinase n=1 Tax=Gemmata sp. TaxID=1914242 RepID=UPI003F72E978
MVGLRWRLLWPAAVATVCLAALCAFTAVSLFHQQATVARVFRGNVESRRAAVELEECLGALIDLENAKVETVGELHKRARLHLRTVREVSDEPEEQRLSEQMAATFAAYLDRWQRLPPPGHPAHEAAVRDATRFLEASVLAPCTEFRLYNGRRLEEITSQHERVLNQLAWGMAWVGGLGAVAGVVFGFSVARALSRSIRRLRVQIRDAAGKIGPAVSEIVVRGEGEFGSLQQEIDDLSARIERVVRELHDREREVVRAEQLAAVGQLAAGVGHEIRNPLTSIKMLAQAGLEDRASPGLSGADLVVIVGEIRRMERSLQTFLDFARPPRAERREVDLLGIVDAVLGLVRGRADKQRVALAVEAAPGPVALTADPNQVHQVLVNLVLNGLDAMPAGGALTVRVRANAWRVDLEVSDTGPGIPRDMVPRLFQPFASSKDTGLGLGLVISKRIVEDHGGTIGAANPAGRGATFYVCLPRRPA